jgi:hypothetical protein
MPQRFASKSSNSSSHSNTTSKSNSIVVSPPLLALGVVALVALGLIVGVTAQGTGGTPGSGSVSHSVGEIDYSQAFSGWPAGWPAPITPTVAGVPVPEPLATMQKFVQAAAWGTGSGVVAESAVTANLALKSNELGDPVAGWWTIGDILAQINSTNDVVYVKCPVAGGPAPIAAPNQPFSLQSQVASYTASNCPNGASDIACPTINGTTYTSKGIFFEPGGLGLSYTMTPNYAANGTIISWSIQFFDAIVGSMVNVCTKNP